MIRTVAFARCALHLVHLPRPLIAQRHHTFPQYLQARALGISEMQLQIDPRFDQTTAEICGTGHDSVHELVRRLLAGATVPKRSKTERMAHYAVDRYRAGGGR